jgi:phosphohistidine phosphatase
MTDLYVVRHGIAVEHGTPGVADDERPLTEEGRRKMRQIGRGLARLAIEPDSIVSSPLPRAWQTAEIIASELELSDRLEASEELRADRSAEAIRNWLLTRSERRIMIVGHNPAFSDLVSVLAAGPAGRLRSELKKGGIAAFSTREGGDFALEWVAPPRLLRRLGDS